MITEAAVPVEAETAEYRRTALHVAAGNDHLEAVTWLVTEAHANVQARDVDGNMPYDLAAKSGHLPVLQYLIREGQMPVNSEATRLRRTALHVAAVNGHFEAVTWLVTEAGANVQAQDKDGWMPHHLAAKSGHLPVLQYLITEAGVPVETETAPGLSTALHVAAQSGQLEAVTWLVQEAHANVHAQDTYGYMPHHFAAKNGHLPVLQYLITEAEAPVEAQTGKRRTVLQLAVKEGHKVVVTWLLIEAHANVQARDLLRQAEEDGSSDEEEWWEEDEGSDEEEW